MSFKFKRCVVFLKCSISILLLSDRYDPLTRIADPSDEDSPEKNFVSKTEKNCVRKSLTYRVK